MACWSAIATLKNISSYILTVCISGSRVSKQKSLPQHFYQYGHSPHCLHPLSTRNLGPWSVCLWKCRIKGSDNLPDPYPLRVKILPGLLEFDRQKNKSLDFKIAVMGQLENSEGHRKINRALTGFFSDKYSHVINSALQFLMQFEFYRELVLKVKPESRYNLRYLKRHWSHAKNFQARRIRRVQSDPHRSTAALIEARSSQN